MCAEEQREVLIHTVIGKGFCKNSRVEVDGCGPIPEQETTLLAEWTGGSSSSYAGEAQEDMCKHPSFLLRHGLTV